MAQNRVSLLYLPLNLHEFRQIFFFLPEIKLNHQPQRQNTKYAMESPKLLSEAVYMRLLTGRKKEEIMQTTLCTNYVRERSQQFVTFSLPPFLHSS